MKGIRIYKSVGLEGYLSGKSRNPYIGKEVEIPCNNKNIRCFNSQYSTRFIYVVDGKNVAVLQIEKYPDENVIMNIFTLEKHRRKGYMLELYIEAKSHFKELEFSFNLSDLGKSFKRSLDEKLKTNGGNLASEAIAGGVLFYCPKTKKMLLLKRSDSVSEPKTWGLVSGNIEHHEDIVDGVKREVVEEIGEVKYDLVNSFVYKKENFTFYNFIGIVDYEFIPKLNYENSEYKWCSISNLPSPLHFGIIELLKNIDFTENDMFEKGGKITELYFITTDGKELSVSETEMNCILDEYESKNELNPFTKALVNIGRDLSKEQIKYNFGGDVLSKLTDEYYYFGIFDRTDKRLLNTYKIRVDQLKDSPLSKIIDIASDKGQYIKEIPSEIHYKFSILDDKGIYDDEIEYKKGGKIESNNYLYIGFFDLTKKLVATIRLKPEQIVSLNFSKIIKKALEMGLSVRKIDKDKFENNSQFHDTFDSLKEGGSIKNYEFDIADIPDLTLYNYANSIKDNYPLVWEIGNRENGDQLFDILGHVAKRGYWLESESETYFKWKSYIDRHQHDYAIIGVISMLKYVGTIENGIDFMKSIVDKEIKQLYR